MDKSEFYSLCVIIGLFFGIAFQKLREVHKDVQRLFSELDKLKDE